MTLEVNKVEYDNLQALASSLEAHLLTATDGTRPLLNNVLNNAKGRLANLEKKIEEERKAEIREKESAIVLAANNQRLVQEEGGLNSGEKEIFGKFLEEEFFTKQDFVKMNEFYTKSWDRLSERGKAQMSHRVWTGIQRGEYTFGELPAVVQKDESKQLYSALTGTAKASPGAESIPSQDKADFIREYEVGDKSAVSQVLSRKSFSQNLSSGKEASKWDASSAKETNIEEKKTDIAKAASEAAKALGTDSFSGFGDVSTVVKPDLPTQTGSKAAARGSTSQFGG